MYPHFKLAIYELTNAHKTRYAYEYITCIASIHTVWYRIVKPGTGL